MTKSQYVAACNRLGISPSYGAAKALCISKASAARYSAGSHPIPPIVAKLLRALVELGRADV